MSRSGDRTCESCGSPLLDDEPSCWRCGHHPGAEMERPPRPLGLTALALLNGAVGLCAAVVAGWALLPAGHLWLAFCAAGYATFRGIAAAALWRVRREGVALQRTVSITELVLFPIGTVLSLLVLLYLRKPRIEALFSGETVRSALPSGAAADRGDDRLLAAVSAVFALLALAATALFVWGIRSAAAGSSAEQRAELPSCSEPEGVSTESTELWRLRMDEIGQVSARGYATISLDPDEAVEGSASVEITTAESEGLSGVLVSLASFPVESYRLGRAIDGRTVFVRARIRDQPGHREPAYLVSSVSGIDWTHEHPMEGRETELGSPWREHELIYVASPEDRRETHQISLSVPAPATVWIDDVRIVRGPKFGGADWRKRMAIERIRAPASGVDEVYRAFTSGDELAPDSLFAAFSGIPAGAEPPDRVQRCLTEMLLAHEARDESDHVRAWLRSRTVGGDAPISPRILRWREAIYRYHQPDYLDRLVRFSPDVSLVSTYGREVVPPMLAHGEEMLGLAKDVLTGGGTTARDFVAMTDLVVTGADAGRWRLTADERTGLRKLLRARLEALDADDAAAMAPGETRDLLVLTLRRLEADQPGAEAPRPVRDASR